VGELGAGAAHELNNPLTGILGNAQMLLEDLKKKRIVLKDAKDREQLVEILESVEKDSYRCSTIIKNLLDFAREGKPEIGDTDINKTIKEALPLVEHQATLQEVEIKEKCDRSIPKIRADKGKLKQVFINLILNAKQAMPNGGLLTISTKLKKDFIYIDFTDTGCGIGKENISKVLDPFFTTRPGGKGTGLGLSVSYGIITGHNGTIEVETKGIGKGATFTVKLPVVTGL